ncbi:MAG: DUF3775 domain-containing protein [Nostoc sp. JL23]|nr:DUF3775 domain-containing protein [Nostoc sp. JL23]
MFLKVSSFKSVSHQVGNCYIHPNYAIGYILERPLLAKYLRDGLQKLDICNSALS